MASTPPASTETSVFPKESKSEREREEPTPSTSTPPAEPEPEPTPQGEPAASVPQDEPATSSPKDDAPPTSSTSPPATAWQAIFSPQFNAYYFYNSETQQTTWDNPLQPTPTDPSAFNTPDAEATTTSAQTSTTTSSSTSTYAALQAAALQAGIDPSLAHLDPSLLSSIPGSSIPGAGPASFTAKFNARTGQFTRPDARDPTHLSEHARATRMSEFYFDVKAWEDELAQRGGALMGAEGGGEGGDGEGKKRKRPSKKDLERFKEQKKQKKIAKTAWLRT